MTMLDDIETAVIDRLTTAGLNVIHWDEAPKLDADRMTGVVGRLLLQTGTFERVTQAKIRCRVEMVIVVDFLKAAAGVDLSRGCYTLLMGVVQQLWNKQLGLSILPIKPGRFSRDFEIQKLNGSLASYALEFETGFTIQETQDEEDTDFLTLGLQYFLQDPEDDGAADAEDVVTLEQ